jgi:hypothetical protein
MRYEQGDFFGDIGQSEDPEKIKENMQKEALNDVLRKKIALEDEEERLLKERRKKLPPHQRALSDRDL